MAFTKHWSRDLSFNMHEKPHVEETPSGHQYLLPGFRLNKKSDDLENKKGSLSLQNKKSEKAKVVPLRSVSKLSILK